MKRSPILALALISSAPVWLTACKEETLAAPVPYASLQACEADGHPADQCKTAMAQAQAAAAAHFGTVAECESHYGPNGCSAVNDTQGHSSFMPIMVGFLVGHMLSGSDRGAPVYRSGYSPAYAKGFSSGAASMPSAPSHASATSSTASIRGGFGASASAHGSSGS